MITREDLLKEISQRELKELSDLNNTQSEDEGIVNAAIESAEAFIGSFFKVPENPTPLLQNIAARFAIRELRRKNEIRMSDIEKESQKDDERYLLQMKKGNLPIDTQEDGAKPSPTRMANQFRKGKKIDLAGFQI